MQRSSAAIQAAKTHWKISWKLPVQQCKNDQLQKSKIEEKYRKMYKKESIRYEIMYGILSFDMKNEGMRDMNIRKKL